VKISQFYIVLPYICAILGVKLIFLAAVIYFLSCLIIAENCFNLDIILDFYCSLCLTLFSARSGQSYFIMSISDFFRQFSSPFFICGTLSSAVSDLTPAGLVLLVYFRSLTHNQITLLQANSMYLL
jgi:hypothetical protein